MMLIDALYVVKEPSEPYTTKLRTESILQAKNNRVEFGC